MPSIDPIDYQYLICHVIKKNRAFLLAHPELKLTAEQDALFQSLLQRREAGEPIAYLTGSRGFWKHDFMVTRDTLIPRPETEMLVETTLKLLDTAKPARILDLGTGSGAIAISLALESPYWQVIASDQSAGALEIARKNAKALQAQNVSFIESDWFETLDSRLRGNDKGGGNDNGFDLIISNPPYIAEQDKHLQEGDLRFEPHSALASGTDGLDALRHIIRHAPDHLKIGGFLLLEHGYDQEKSVRALLLEAGFLEVKTLKDLQGWPRVSVGRLLTDTKS